MMMMFVARQQVVLPWPRLRHTAGRNAQWTTWNADLCHLY